MLPALVLNYFGQGALLLANPAAIKNPFYLMAPGWALLPAVRKQQVCQLDEERMGLLLRPGHRMGEAAHMLVDCLQALPPSDASMSSAHGTPFF